MSNVEQWTKYLEQEWEKPNGFIGRVREGLFIVEEGRKFVDQLKQIDISDEKVLEKRFVSLLWYIPIFLSWQQDRIAEHNGDVMAFEKVSAEIQTVVEDILGVP